jgi:hypothetical protein
MRLGRKIDSTFVDPNETRKNTIGNHNTNIDTHITKSANSIRTTLADRATKDKQNAAHRTNEALAWRYSTESDSKTQHRPVNTQNQRWKRNLTHQNATVTGAGSQLGIAAPRRRQSHNIGPDTSTYNQLYIPLYPQTNGAPVSMQSQRLIGDYFAPVNPGPKKPEKQRTYIEKESYIVH